MTLHPKAIQYYRMYVLELERYSKIANGLFDPREPIPFSTSLITPSERLGHLEEVAETGQITSEAQADGKVNYPVLG